MKKQIKKTVVRANPAPVVAVAHKPNPQMHGPSKTFQKDGHWIEKPEKTAILLCVCGNRYLKTRVGQELCLRCVSLGR
jgi:hypothetical protein